MVLFAVITTFTPVIADMTILHVAVPSLTVALGATETEVLWIIDVYPLVMAGLLVPMGTLGERIGHRRVMLIGLCLFTLASVAAAFSAMPKMLIASRALLALGGPMITPAVLAIVRQTFEDERERSRALGTWTIVGSSGRRGGAVGPLAGGFLLEHFGWGSVFLMSVPIMAVVLPLAYRILPEGKADPAIERRVGQAIVLLVGLVATAYAVKTGAKGDDPAWQPLSAFVVGVALLGWFGRPQARAAQPVLDLSLFRHPPLVASLPMVLFSSGAIAGIEVFLAQELQFVVGLPPLDAGLLMLPVMAAAAAAVSGPVAGWMVGFVGLHTLSTARLLVAAVSFAALAMVDLHGDRYVSGTLLAAFGFSLGSTLLVGPVAIIGGAPAEDVGAAGALESTPSNSAGRSA